MVPLADHLGHRGSPHEKRTIKTKNDYELLGALDLGVSLHPTGTGGIE